MAGSRFFGYNVISVKENTRGAGSTGYDRMREERLMPNRNRPRIILALIAAASLAVSVSAVRAQDITYFKATLNASSEVPPNASTGTGEGTFDYDPATKQLNWTVNYSDLTGGATAAHIHGPAAAGANAGVMIPFPNAASPIIGSATLTDGQVADLMAGRLYVNVHTAANPGGEIRGQIVP
jgi:hypothetical protein